MTTPDPSYALQNAIFDTLTAANVGAPIMHTVRAGTSLPWAVIGDDHILSDYDADYYSECHSTVHVFASNKPAAKLIAAKVRAALDAHIPIDGFCADEAWLEDIRHMTDPDGQTAHSVLTFRYLVRAADQ